MNDLETPQVPVHNTQNTSPSALSSASSVSDLTDSHFSWDMDGSPVLPNSDGSGDANMPNHATGELTLTPHTRHFYPNGMVDIRVCSYSLSALGCVILTATTG